MDKMTETGTVGNVVVVDLQHCDEWLIRYGADPEAGLLWSEIRVIGSQEREALGKRLTDAGIDWEMLNITSVRDQQPFTIEEYIADIENEKA
jgi:hypothetical protein